MRRQAPRSRENTARNPGRNSSDTPASETDPLLEAPAPSYLQQTQGVSTRARRSSRSPTLNPHFDRRRDQMKNYPLEAGLTGNDLEEGSKGSSSRYVPGNRSSHTVGLQHQQDNEAIDDPPLLEIPEQIYAVRKAALSVLKPLTKTWVSHCFLVLHLLVALSSHKISLTDQLVVSVGFALTVLFGMARWTRLLQNLPYWFILLPSWLSHVGLFWCHLDSAKALSIFISEANDSRQRPDSRDHLDRTEYLPLLQRSLKFGLKTGLISVGFFIFEILVYVRLAKGTMSLSAVFTPLWIMVTIGILDGIICKAQHPLRVICWMLSFTAMLLACLKVDYGLDFIQWSMVVSPIVTVLSISSATLIYMIYGHQIGYYRLTESQLTAGNLYSLAALISIVLVVVIGEITPLSRPVEIETRVFVVFMAPLVVTLVGMGAWVVSRDEYSRLLVYGGQSAVHPKKLRWQAQGWTSIQGRGVANIPMFGEVSFHPLEQREPTRVEMCACCSCYPAEDEDDIPYPDELKDHPYLAPTAPQYTQPQIV
eukprot:scaffold675_cov103-Cylindrotheca_fusiformis.AAC.7